MKITINPKTLADMLDNTRTSVDGGNKHNEWYQALWGLMRVSCDGVLSVIARSDITVVQATYRSIDLFEEGECNAPDSLAKTLRKLDASVEVVCLECVRGFITVVNPSTVRENLRDLYRSPEKPIQTRLLKDIPIEPNPDARQIYLDAGMFTRVAKSIGTCKRADRPCINLHFCTKDSPDPVYFSTHKSSSGVSYEGLMAQTRIPRI